MKKKNTKPTAITNLDDLITILDADKLRNVYGGSRDRRDVGAV